MSLNKKKYKIKFVNTTIAVLKGKFTALNTYIMKEEKPQISNLSSDFKDPGKKEQKWFQSDKKEGNNKYNSRNQ